MSVVEVKINESEFTAANALLAKVDKQLRGKAVEESLHRAAQVVVDAAKVEVPQPGYPGDKPGLKPLRDTISHEVRSYSSGTFVAIVGAQWPAGAHAMLVEKGHEIWLPSPPYTAGASTVNTGRRTEADPWLERASDNTQANQIGIIVSTLKQHSESV